MLDDISLNVPAATPISRSLSKSTPRDPAIKFHSTPKTQPSCRTEDDISVQPHSQLDDQSIWPPEDVSTNSAATLQPSQIPQTSIEDLPSEILELIVGYVVGHLGSASSVSTGSENVVKNWNEIMRHPRRRNVADLALVSPTWRRLIQERLFRHIKVQGTVEAQEQCSDFFLAYPHLQQYVRHLQVIVPIWEMKRTLLENDSMSGSNHPTRSFFLQAFQALLPSSPDAIGTPVDTSQIFQLASKNATVSEIFFTARVMFPELCALTIEAGHCKRPPQIKFFRSHSRPRSVSSCPSSLIQKPLISSNLPYTQETPQSLPSLPSVKTLILKGAWNIIRAPADFLVLANSLPNLQEFHCNYHALKTDAYITMCLTLRQNLSSSITRLNISLDGLYTKQITSLQKWRKVFPAWHVCMDIGQSLPQLESLTYTGRLCHEIFSAAIPSSQQDGSTSPTNNRLKSVDLIVNNVCCDPWLHSDATGIQHYPFIEAFEALIKAAVRSLSFFIALGQMRIRFIDLDSPAPLLNPMFHLERSRAWGFWSEEILHLIREARPSVVFLGLRGRLVPAPELEEVQENKRSLSVEHYRAMAHGGVLIH